MDNMLHMMLQISWLLTIIIIQERRWDFTGHGKARAKKKPDMHRAFQ